jgi:hypothetical protein
MICRHCLQTIIRDRIHVVMTVAVIEATMGIEGVAEEVGIIKDRIIDMVDQGLGIIEIGEGG